MSIFPSIYVVTGNASKLAEFKRLLPAKYKFESVNLDLTEIQSFDPQAVIKDKVERAYEELGRPVMVEDVFVGLDSLNGLPGPFFKFFEQRLGVDALYKLSGKEAPATVISTIGYYDGSKLIICQGTVHGTAVKARGSNGFGFDACFMPVGQIKTYGEMSPEEKDAVSHRSLSVAAFKHELKQL